MSVKSLIKKSWGCSIASAVVTISACTAVTPQPNTLEAYSGRDPDRLLVVDCLLPGQLRRLGRNITFLTPRRPTKVSASECEIRGGEYVAYDRANFATSLKIWLPKAESGDPEAQTLVGEIFEKGLGQIADPAIAAQWYRKAADQGYSRAKINLGYLYESGLGVQRDLTIAMNFYRDAAGFGDGTLEYVTSIQLATREQQAREIPALQREVAEANTQLADERQAFEQLQTDYRALEQQAESIRKELKQNSDSTIASSETDAGSTIQVNKLLVDMDALKQQLTSSQSDRSQLVRELEAQQLQTGGLRQRVSETSTELYKAQDELTEQESYISDLEQQLVDQKNTTADKNGQSVAEIEALLIQSVSSRDALQQQILKLKKEQTAESEQLRTKLQMAETRERSLLDDLGRTRNTSAALQQDLQSKDRDYREQLASLNQSKTGLQSRIQTQQSTIDELQNKISEIQNSANKQSAENTLEASNTLELLQADLYAAQNELKDVRSTQSPSQTNSVAELARVENELQQQLTLVESQQDKLETLQKNSTNSQAMQQGPAIEDIPAVFNTGPEIEIIDPPVTIRNGAVAVPVMSSSGSVNLIGRVSSSDELISFRINGGQEELNEHGIFQHAAVIGRAPRLALAAVDSAGGRTALDIDLMQQTSDVNSASTDRYGEVISLDVSQVDFGEYHALIIGNGEYNAMPTVGTAINDATAVAKVLESRFGFKTELLFDADRYDILAALNRKRDELTRKDNLLIYFSGHGAIGNSSGYWFPVDANPNDKSTWVSNASVTSMIDSMNAKHVMIVADSVFSGTLSRSSIVRMGPGMDADQKLRIYELAANSKVRTVLSSGAESPFAGSEASSNHSLFTKGVLDALGGDNSNVIMAHDLFVHIRKQLDTTADANRTSPLPQYAPLKYAGHENGEFLFVPIDKLIGQNSIVTHPLVLRSGHGS